ncbi:conserved phage C-terminal domain-containing protein [Lacticaseibacillus jixiensis]|uniref:conserved phage C-terminal domain-containing protein n=1 Tax=Lacticaseibacillus jixiensis TaxID=3231926 RepID=UPI0036F2DB1D
MADGGWIKLYRKTRQSFVWTDSDQLKLWILLLMKASHNGNRFLFNGQEVVVSSGQLVTGAHALAFEFNDGVPRDNQVTWRKLWRWVKRFENAQMLTIKSTNKYSVISVLHWSEYQFNDNQMTTQVQPNDNPVTTIKNAKNAKKEPSSPAKAEPAFNYAGVIEYLNEKSGKHYHNTPNNRKLIHARLADGYTSKDIAQAINNVCKGWLNTESERYIRPSTIFAASKFEGYVSDVPYGRPKAEQDDIPAPTVDKFDPAKWAVTAYRSLGSVESVIETAKSDGVPITEEQIQTAVAKFNAERNDEE